METFTDSVVRVLKTLDELGGQTWFGAAMILVIVGCFLTIVPGCFLLEITESESAELQVKVVEVNWKVTDVIAQKDGKTPVTGGVELTPLGDIHVDVPVGSELKVCVLGITDDGWYVIADQVELERNGQCYDFTENYNLERVDIRLVKKESVASQ